MNQPAFLARRVFTVLFGDKVQHPTNVLKVTTAQQDVATPIVRTKPPLTYPNSLVASVRQVTYVQEH